MAAELKQHCSHSNELSVFNDRSKEEVVKVHDSEETAKTTTTTVVEETTKANMVFEKPTEHVKGKSKSFSRGDTMVNINSCCSVTNVIDNPKANQNYVLEEEVVATVKKNSCSHTYKNNFSVSKDVVNSLVYSEFNKEKQPIRIQQELELHGNKKSVLGKAEESYGNSVNGGIDSDCAVINKTVRVNNKISLPVRNQSTAPIVAPNNTPKRRSSVVTSADYLKRIGSNAATSMKKLSTLVVFKKHIPETNSFVGGSCSQQKTVDEENMANRTRKKALHHSQPHQGFTLSDSRDSSTCDASFSSMKSSGFNRSDQQTEAPEKPKTELELSDPEFVEYFQQNVSTEDKEFVRKYIELKQNLESKLNQLEQEYTKLLGLENTADLQNNLSSLDNAHGDDLISNFIELFEMNDNPEKVSALSIYRDFGNYIRELQNCAFDNVFTLIDIKTMQNNINTKRTSPMKKKTLVFESNAFNSDTHVFSTAQFLSRLKPGSRSGPCQHDVATAVLEDVLCDKIEPLMHKVRSLPPATKRLTSPETRAQKISLISGVLNFDTHTNLYPTHVTHSDFSRMKRRFSKNESFVDENDNVDFSMLSNSRKNSSNFNSYKTSITDLDIELVDD